MVAEGRGGIFEGHFSASQKAAMTLPTSQTALKYQACALSKSAQPQARREEISVVQVKSVATNPGRSMMAGRHIQESPTSTPPA
jgi:hypothetical protein